MGMMGESLSFYFLFSGSGKSNDNFDVYLSAIYSFHAWQEIWKAVKLRLWHGCEYFGKNGRDIGECLSVPETRYLVRSACVQKLECSWRHHKKGLPDKHYLEDQRGYYMGFNDVSIRRMCKILILRSVIQ